MTESQLTLLTPEEKAAWERCEKATAGEWHKGYLGTAEQPVVDAGTAIAHFAKMIVDTIEAQREHRPFLSVFAKTDDGNRTVALTLHGMTNFENTDFIAHSRSDLPAALEEIARLRENLSRATDALSFIRRHCSYLDEGFDAEDLLQKIWMACETMVK